LRTINVRLPLDLARRLRAEATARRIERAEEEMRALPVPAWDGASGRGDDTDALPELDAARARA